MKAIGALLVVLSCSAFGMSMARTLKRREMFLRSLAMSLTILRNELCISLLPVKDVLALLAGKKDPAAAFFAACLEAFDDGVRTAWSYAAMDSRWPLEEDERNNLASLAEVIGRYDADKQRELIERVTEYFKARADAAGEDWRRQYKLRAALGVGSGLMLAILML